MKTVTVRQRLIGEDIDIGEGAIILLERATPPIIGFLRLRYLENPDCLEGDIEDLFLMEGEGLTEEDCLREF